MNVKIYKNNYCIDDNLIPYLNKFNIELNENYYDYLSKYKDPSGDFSADFIKYVNADIKNKLLIKEYGKIICDNSGGFKLYADLPEAILSNFDSNSRFYFYNLLECILTDYNFFGFKINDFITNTFVRDLNSKIRNIIYNTHYDNDKIYRKYLCSEKKLGGLSFDDFLNQERRYESFFVCNKIDSYKNTMFPKKRSKINFEDYNKILSDVLNRYSLRGECAFINVKKFNYLDKDLCKGIYILCLKDKLGFYVGKSKMSIRNRIFNHIYNMETYFDYNLIPSDISDIYILHMDKEYINEIEQDLISFIPQEYSFNICPGGDKNSELTYFSSYKPENYLLENSKLESAIRYSLRERKEYEFQIDYLKDEEKCRSKSKKLLIIEDNKKTYNLCYDSVRYNGELISYVPENLRDKELCLAALESRYGTSIKKIVPYFPQEVLTYDFALEIVKKYHNAFYYLPDEYKTTEMKKATGFKKYNNI